MTCRSELLRQGQIFSRGALVADLCFQHREQTCIARFITDSVGFIHGTKQERASLVVASQHQQHSPARAAYCRNPADRLHSLCRILICLLQALLTSKESICISDVVQHERTHQWLLAFSLQ